MGGLSRRSILKAAGASAAGLAAAGGGSALRAILKHRPAKNVILIVADALRADRIGRKILIDGVLQSMTPNWDILESNGLCFDNVFAPSSWTPISIGAILYNTSPFNVGYAGRLEIRNAGESIVRRFAEKGCYTAAVNANWVLDTDVIRDGFDKFISMPRSSKVGTHAGVREAYKCAESVNEAALSMLGELKRSPSFFLYLHYMDTHEPYYCPGRYLYRLGLRLEERACPTIVREKLLSGEKALAEGVSLKQGIEQMEGQYNAAALYWDAEMRKLLDRFDGEGLLDDTLVIVTSDHGEEFADNLETDPNVGHATNLSLPQIHSPLLIWSKGGNILGQKRFTAPASLTRVVNSVLGSYVATDGENDPWGALEDAVAPPDAPILSALNFKGFNGFSLIWRGVKVNGLFSADKDFERIEAFQINRPSGPARLSDVPLAVASRMREVLSGHWRPSFSEGDLGSAEREQLRALGYLN